jgi:hypothetical protein
MGAMEPTVPPPAAPLDAPPLKPGFHDAVSEFKRRLIATTLERAGGNRSRAARTLGLQRTYLLRLIREFEIRVPAAGVSAPNGATDAASGTATTPVPAATAVAAAPAGAPPRAVAPVAASSTLAAPRAPAPPTPVYGIAAARRAASGAGRKPSPDGLPGPDDRGAAWRPSGVTGRRGHGRGPALATGPVRADGRPGPVRRGSGAPPPMREGPSAGARRPKR